MKNPYQKKYKEQSIMQMSPAELLLFTFDECIKNLKKAEVALEDKRYALFDESVDRAGRIVRYLLQTLDLEQPVSRDLQRLYDYVIYDLSIVKAGRERRKEELPALQGILQDLRDGFEGASKQVPDVRAIRENRVMA